MKLALMPEWQALEQHCRQWQGVPLIKLFNDDPERLQRLSLEWHDFYLDYSKNFLTTETLQLLFNLAKVCDWRGAIQRLISGGIVNPTADLPALHMALRGKATDNYTYQDQALGPLVQQNLQRLAAFSEQVRQGYWRGFTGKAITDVVNIGIGGSDLGPKLVVNALSPLNPPQLKIHFLAEIDPIVVEPLLASLNPETTLFVIASKSFTTLETLVNARRAKAWLNERLGKPQAFQSHMVAISSCFDQVEQFGLTQEQYFPLWDWVGGRFSVWSSVGLPVILALGMPTFQALLEGARAMDCHFQTADAPTNMPLLLAMIGIWQRNFLNYNTQLIRPYDLRLQALPNYIQQLTMESNGKAFNLTGEPVDYATSPIVWGDAGTTAQHSYHQLLHQGTETIPTDILAVVNDACHDAEGSEARQHLLANALAQAQALMEGSKTSRCQGNCPSNLLLLRQLTPFNLGALLALYEHKTFLQSVIWQVNAFDQPGVELGKQQAKRWLAALQHQQTNSAPEYSKLLEKINEWRH